MKESLSIREIDDAGNIYHYLNDPLAEPDQLHREDGPAVEYYSGAKFWYFYDELHRLDGPAIEKTNGHQEWWIHGKKIPCSSQVEFEKLIKLRSFW